MRRNRFVVLVFIIVAIGAALVLVVLAGESNIFQDDDPTLAPAETVYAEAALLRLLPRDTIAFVYWNLENLPPTGKLEEILSVSDDLDYAANFERMEGVFAEFGIPFDSVGSVLAFLVPETTPTNSLSYEIIVSVDEYNQNAFVSQFVEQSEMASIREVQYWIHSSGSAFWTSDDYVVVGTSGKTVSQVIQQSQSEEFTVPLGIGSALEPDHRLGAILRFNDQIDWPLPSLSVGFRIRDGEVIVSNAESGIHLSATGKIGRGRAPSVQSQVLESTVLANGAVIPHPALWADLLLRAADEHQISYSLRESEFELTAVWVH